MSGASRDITQLFTRVPRSQFDDYAEKYKDWFDMERRHGIIQLRMHTNGGPANIRKQGGPWIDVWSQAWREVGNDPDNKVLIITGTGDYYLEETDEAEPVQKMSQEQPKLREYYIFCDALRSTQNLIFDIDIPTIGAINGPSIPGFHTEHALLCDITLCTEDTILRDPHCEIGVAPGNGLGMVFQELMGAKRAAFYLYTSDGIDAQMALQLGLVNEVVPADRLLPRAWEIAERIMEIPELTRLMTKQIIRLPWQRRHVENAAHHLAHEILGAKFDSDLARGDRHAPARDSARAMIAGQQEDAG